MWEYIFKANEKYGINRQRKLGASLLRNKVFVRQMANGTDDHMNIFPRITTFAACCCSLLFST